VTDGEDAKHISLAYTAPPATDADRHSLAIEYLIKDLEHKEQQFTYDESVRRALGRARRAIAKNFAKSYVPCPPLTESDGGDHLMVIK
jgi:hypothetical protein